MLPVRVYQTENRIMVMAPMPGLEPQDISVTVHGNRVTIRGEMRGPHQHDLDLLIAEWAVGPYYREIDLSQPVNGALTNATYGNGVLVLAMPKMSPEEQGIPAEIRLDVLEDTRGEHVGHTGQDIRPMPTQAPRHKAYKRVANATAGPDPPSTAMTL